MWPDRTPDTPQFRAALESRLCSAARSKRRRLFPLPTTALRAVRSLSTSSLHVMVAVCLASVFFLTTPGPMVSTGDPATPADGNLHLDGRIDGLSPPARTGPVLSVEEATSRSRELGYEISVIPTFVADRASDGSVLVIRHLGTDYPTIPTARQPRGPLVVVVGVAVADQSAIAG